ncbi:hypothetical protein HDV00_009780 [Rhizophlyctis rosea]|nr:hypothetical protein HDV00_009780 [Rhizophlyctis rosea]
MAPIEIIPGYDSVLYENFIPDAGALYRRVLDEVDFIPRDMLTMTMYGKTSSLPRDKAFYGEVRENGLRPHYRYPGDYVPIAEPWTPTVKDIKDYITDQGHGRCNHVVVNRYLNGNDHISFHRDKTRDFVDKAPVLTVSFGETRILRLKKHDGTNQQMDVPLRHGSLFKLGWKTNQDYKHCIVKQTAKGGQNVGTRVRLTYRNIATRMDSEGNIYVFE